MAETIMVDVTGLADYTPFEGLGASDLFDKDGRYKGVVEKVRVGKSKGQNPRAMLTLAVVAQDEDAAGRRIIHNVVVGGVDKNGNSMIRQLGDVLISIGFSQEKVRSIAGKKSLNLNDVADKNIQGKTVFFDARAESFTDDAGNTRATSKITSFVNKAQYEEAIAIRSHRRNHTFSAGAKLTTAAGGGLDLDTPEDAAPNGKMPKATTAMEDDLASGI